MTQASSFAFLRPPSPFNFQNPKEWPEWYQEFDDYRFASGLSEKSSKSQVRTLLYSMGREARKILTSFALSSEEEDEYDTVKEKFDGHFVIRRNEVYESAVFNLRRQLPNESVDQFATALYSLSEHCNFGSMRDRLIRDRFVVGLSDKQLSESMQLDPNLTLAIAIDKARQKEAVHLQQQELSSLDPRSSHVNSVKKKTSFSQKKAINHKVSNKGQEPERELKSCGFCGGASHPRPQCPANNATCHSCKKRGHFSKVCKTKSNKSQREISSVAGKRSEDETPYYVGSIDEPRRNSLFTDIAFNNCLVKFKVDSGADVSLVSPLTPGVPQNLEIAHEQLLGPDGTPLKVRGKFKTTVLCNGHSSVQTLFVVDNLVVPLLGWKAIQDLHIALFAGMTERKMSNKERYVSQFPELFKGLGLMKNEHKITLSEESVPYAIHIARRIPLPLREKVKLALDEQEKLGVIRRITEPSSWCAGLVPVVKPNGAIRLCVDFTKLNKSVVKEKTIMPTVEESLGLLGEAKVFSKLDANSGFFQIPLTEDCQQLTTFITPFGRYCFTRLPFGITSLRNTSSNVCDSFSRVYQEW